MTSHSLHWRPARLALRLTAVGIVGVVMGLGLGRVEPIIMATPCLAALAVSVRPRRPLPSRLTARITLSESRCFEDEPVRLTGEVAAPERVGQISVIPVGGTMMKLEPTDVQTVVGSAAMGATWTMRARRWGRWNAAKVVIHVWSNTLTDVATLELDAGELSVYPPPARAREVTLPPKLLARIGNHVSQVAGVGTEFAGIRPYVPGDVPRRINWPVSTRRGTLHVNTYANERAADVVTLVDTTVDVGPQGNSSVDNAVRGAAATAQRYLAYTDRVGVVGFGTRLRWLTPDVSARQYYRIVETLLSSRGEDSSREPALNRIPRTALPSGALVFVFSPMLADAVLEAIRDLAERGHSVIVVDVLNVEPTGAGLSAPDLAVRIWRLERDVVRHRLRGLGVAVVPWETNISTGADQPWFGPQSWGRR